MAAAETANHRANWRPHGVAAICFASLDAAGRLAALVPVAEGAPAPKVGPRLIQRDDTRPLDVGDTHGTGSAPPHSGYMAVQQLGTPRAVVVAWCWYFVIAEERAAAAGATVVPAWLAVRQHLKVEMAK